MIKVPARPPINPDGFPYTLIDDDLGELELKYSMGRIAYYRDVLGEEIEIMKTLDGAAFSVARRVARRMK